MTDLQSAQLEAFDEVVATLDPNKGWLARNGLKARVIPAPFRNSRILQEAGYNTQGLTSIDIKRSDFVKLGIALDSKDLVLDAQAGLRVVDIGDDDTDAIVNVALKVRN